jgi:hypothetical protein
MSTMEDEFEDGFEFPPSSSSSAAKLHGACIPAQAAAAGGVTRLAAILDGERRRMVRSRGVQVQDEANF